MKQLRITALGLGIAAISFLCSTSCNKETPHVATTDTDFSNAATVQVFNATVKSARNYIYVDGVPVSGAAVAYGGVFPSIAYAFKVAAGARSFSIKDTLITSTQAPLNFTQTLDGGKSYTIFTYDTTTSIKQTTVMNTIVVPTDTSSRLRFANFIYNPTAVANVDAFSYRKGGVGGTAATPVFANVPTGSVTDFISYSSGITDTLYVYATGTTSPLLAKTFVTSLTPTRSYTTVYNGSYRGTKAISTFATY